MAPTPKFTQEQGADFRKRHEAGETIRDISQEYGGGRNAFTNIKAAIVRAGGSVRNDSHRMQRRKHADRNAEFVRRHQGGETAWAIARDYKLSPESVRCILKREGVYRPRESGVNTLAKGFCIGAEGYRLVRAPKGWTWPEMVRTNGYMPEHRKVMAETLGRALREDETVHHIDGDRLNNDPANLQLRQGRHGNGVAYKCCSCGSVDVQPYELDS